MRRLGVLVCLLMSACSEPYVPAYGSDSDHYRCNSEQVKMVTELTKTCVSPNQTTTSRSHEYYRCWTQSIKLVCDLKEQ